MDIRGSKLTKWTEVNLIGLNGTEIDPIELNRKNSLIFRKNKLSSTHFREKIVHC